MTVEISVALLVFFLTIILAVYNQRQASALRGMERLVQDFVAMQIRDRRTRHINGLADLIDPLEWLARQASSELDTPLIISDVMRVVHEIQAVELRASGGLRVIVSTSPKSDVMRFDRRLRAAGIKNNAAERVASFAARPLLGKSRWGWGVQTVERVMSQANEFFDIEADAVSERLGLKWGKPSRLWFYVVK
jgi:HAMP domain-containing protein